jgi:hypothetical protein
MLLATVIQIIAEFFKIAEVQAIILLSQRR